MTSWAVPPLLVPASLVAVGADLDLLPLTAALIAAGLLPIGMREQRQSTPEAPR